MVACGAFLLSSCASSYPRKSYEPHTYQVPDYGDLKLWAAHPDKEDPSDRHPDKNPPPVDLPQVDVFFLHPTSYTNQRGNDQWNAGFGNIKVDKKTDEGTILFQASAFNSVGPVYAPRYRQAHLQTYFTSDTASAKKALDWAYRDIRAAFIYYLENYNRGKPIIIASHSQGTTHAVRLMLEFFDGKPLYSQLVAAYLVGMPVSRSTFTAIPPCANENETGCFTSWRTFKREYTFKKKEGDVVVTNPLSWRTDTVYIDKTKNPGTILKDFNDVYPALVDAQVSKNILWATKPKFPGSFFLWVKNYHVADINFYYFSIRQNTRQRKSAYFRKSGL